MNLIINLTKDYLMTFAKGLIIGVANIIPGVSGGTMALIMGIYERMINAIHSISFKTIKSFFMLFTFKKTAFKNFCEEHKKIDAVFLGLILLGALISIASLAKIMTYLLNVLHDPTYGFFFGLVLASVYVPFALIKKKNILTIVFCLVAAASIIVLDKSVSNEEKINKEKVKYELELKNSTATGINQVKKTTTTVQYIFFFIAGAIAISAMILPGISGSFLLLLMGQYFILLEAISDKNFKLLGVFILGSMFGIVLFTRFLNWLLKSFHDLTMAFLTGLVIGSLYVIWPFKNFVFVGPKKVFLNNIIPAGFNSNEIITICTVTIGIFIVTGLILIEKYNLKKPDKSL